MATIASLIINIAANTSAWTAGANQVKKDAAGLDKSLLALGAKFAPAAIGSAAFAGIRKLVDDSEQAISSQTKLAGRLGLTTQQMAGLDFGAKRLGIDSAVLGTSFQHLQREIAQAGVQGSEAQKKFQSLGIDPDKLKLGDFAGNIGKIADTINKIPDAAQRSAAYFQLLGRHGLDLVPILAQGSKGIQAMEDRARRFNLAFTGAEGAAVLAGTRAWTAAWADTKAAIDGAGQRLAVLTAGAGIPTLVSRHAEGWATIVTLAENAGRRIAAGFNEQTLAENARARAAEDAAAAKKTQAEKDVLNQSNIRIAVAELNKELDLEYRTFQLSAAAKKAAALADKTGATAAQLRVTQSKVARNEAQQAQKEFKDISQAQYVQHLQEAAAFEQAGYALTGYLANLKRVAEGKKEFSAAQQDQLNAQAKQNQFDQEGRKIVEEQRTALEKYNREQTRYNQLVAMGSLTDAQADRARVKNLQDLASATGQLNALNSTGPATTAGGGSLESDKTILQSQLKGALGNPLERVADILAQALAQDKLANDVRQRILQELKNPKLQVVTK